jgi:hypothetical protein
MRARARSLHAVRSGGYNDVSCLLLFHYRHLSAFLSSVADDDIHVCKEAIQLVSTGASVQPALIEHALPEVMPALLRATQVDSSLIKMIDLGPFKHKQDLGLVPRKYAFECFEVRPRDLDVKCFWDCLSGSPFVWSPGILQRDLHRPWKLVFEWLQALRHSAPSQLCVDASLHTSRCCPCACCGHRNHWPT